ncbi:MAG: 5-formyltetrahydrofolate cyclo-ligase [Kiritimatiellales bacterium]|nr:5-formyltetrahydrofolate cyclo-ligase [Kiritimatiellales bacterium]
MKSKQQLRRDLGDKRRALDFQWLEESSRAMMENFLALEEFRNAGTIGLFMPLPGEPDLRGLFPKLWKNGQHICIPVYHAASGQYRMAGITEQTVFRTGHYGIQEPVGFPEVGKDEISLFIVPGVAFDVSGNRLGRGGGYYDRLLDAFQGVCMGAAFDFQVFGHIPHLPHDKPMQVIVTERQIIKVCDERSTNPAV